LFVCFEARSCCVAQDGLELEILLPQYLKYWDYRSSSPCLVKNTLHKRRQTLKREIGNFHQLTVHQTCFLLEGNVSKFKCLCFAYFPRIGEERQFDNAKKGLVWCGALVITALRRKRQEDFEFEASLGYTASAKFFFFLFYSTGY
jgi:hypothetical protein